MNRPSWSRLACAGLALGALGAGALVLAVHDLPDALTPAQVRDVAVLLDDVRLVSMVPGDPDAQPGRAVLVVGDRIAEVGPAGALQPPRGTRVVAGQGRTLMPGLIDAHVHVMDEAELAGYLAHGVTGVRHMSGSAFHLGLADRIDRGMLLGPELQTTGPILNSHGPNEQPLQQFVATADEARAAVRAQHAAGFRTVKVYSNLTAEAFGAIVDEARGLGMPLTGHTPEGVRGPGVPWDAPFDVPWEASLGRGFLTLEHVETLVWHGLRDDLDEDRMADLAARLAASGEAVTPTLIAHRRLVSIAETRGAWLDRPGSETINPLVRLVDGGSEAFWSQADPTAYERPHADFFLTATGLLHDAGVPLLAGTDAGGFGLIPGASMARELELLVQAGLSPHQALSAATRVNAQVLGMAQTGVVAPGAPANLVLLAADPLVDVGAVEHPVGVMVRGAWFDEAALEGLAEAAGQTSLVRTMWRALWML